MRYISILAASVVIGAVIIAASILVKKPESQSTQSVATAETEVGSLVMPDELLGTWVPVIEPSHSAYDDDKRRDNSTIICEHRAFIYPARHSQKWGDSPETCGANGPLRILRKNGALIYVVMDQGLVPDTQMRDERKFIYDKTSRQVRVTDRRIGLNDGAWQEGWTYEIH